MTDADFIAWQCWAPVPGGVGVFDPPITTLNAFEALLKQRSKFSADDIWETADIHQSTVFQNGVLTLDFGVLGKTSRAYGWARANVLAPTETTFKTVNRAVLIIPGSGMHQATEILYNPTNYHGDIMAKMRLLADTFVYVRAGHDFRAQHNGVNCIDTGVFNNYAALNGTSYHNNEMVEIFAMLQWLKGQYGKVAMLGLSAGALKAVLAAIYGGADGCVCASGMSLKEYETIGFGAYGGNLISGLPDKASFISDTQDACRLLITYGKSEPYSISRWEADNGYTAALFAGSQKVTVLAHPGGHIYPQPAVNNFVAECLA